MSDFGTSSFHPASLARARSWPPCLPSPLEKGHTTSDEAATYTQSFDLLLGHQSKNRDHRSVHNDAKRLAGDRTSRKRSARIAREQQGKKSVAHVLGLLRISQTFLSSCPLAFLHPVSSLSPSDERGQAEPVKTTEFLNFRPTFLSTNTYSSLSLLAFLLSSSATLSRETLFLVIVQDLSSHPISSTPLYPLSFINRQPCPTLTSTTFRKNPSLLSTPPLTSAGEPLSARLTRPRSLGSMRKPPLLLPSVVSFSFEVKDRILFYLAHFLIADEHLMPLSYQSSPIRTTSSPSPSLLP